MGGLSLAHLSFASRRLDTWSMACAVFPTCNVRLHTCILMRNFEYANEKFGIPKNHHHLVIVMELCQRLAELDWLNHKDPASCSNGLSVWYQVTGKQNLVAGTCQNVITLFAKCRQVGGSDIFCLQASNRLELEVSTAGNYFRRMIRGDLILQVSFSQLAWRP